MNFEIRDGRLHLAGYVNAVERDSKVIMTARGRCVEQVAAGAFAASMADGHEIRMMLDHKRNIGTTTDGTLSLKEDNIGLYAEASTDDEELMMLAGKGELRGWSFGFVAKDDEIEERSGKEPRRRVKALDLQEVSILSVMPAYNGTSIECRSYDECALPEDVDIVDDGVDDGTAEDVDTVDTSAVDELRAYVELMKMKGYILRKREEQRALEMRYNHYHDPVNGRFVSGWGVGRSIRDEMTTPVYFGHGDSGAQLKKDFNQYGYAAYTARQTSADTLRGVIYELEHGRKVDLGWKDKYGHKVEALPGYVDEYKNALGIRERIDRQDTHYREYKASQAMQRKAQKATERGIKTAMRNGQMSLFG